MQNERRDLFRKYWRQLVDLTEVQALAQTMITSNVFTDTDISNIFDNQDEMANKDRFFQEIINKSDPDFIKAYDILVMWLNCTGHEKLALILNTKVIAQPDTEEENEELTSSIESEPLPIDYNTTPLQIRVRIAKEFKDTKKRNHEIPYYSSRSKRRGRVLIINNYDFTGTGHTQRNGAKVDQENLCQLFQQMGGWDIRSHSNQTADEMREILKHFSVGDRSEDCDICFVIIMSHGSENLNETIVYGSDGHALSTRTIQNFFTNKKCPFFRNKPKVFIYQVCRGPELDLPGIQRREEFDGKPRGKHKFTGQQHVHPQEAHKITNFFRPVDDMLIGYATMQGSRAHRDPDRGTWYIELICEDFMKLAKYESVDNLLTKVDAGLRKRISEYGTVQTGEHISKGFKKLYLNPGIYEEEGKLKRFDEGEATGCCIK